MEKPAWMKVAESFLGEQEKPGPLHNEKIVEMFRLIEQPDMKADEIPWCAAAVGACLSLAGYENSKSALARSYENFGEDLGRVAMLGCIAVFSRGRKDSRLGHVGFYAGERDGKILLLGGNQKNGFNVAPYAKSRLLSYRWPVKTSPLPNSFLPNIFDIDAPSAPAHIVGEPANSTPIRTSVALSRKFRRCHEIIGKWEGGYADHPRDPGGATNFGITRGTLSDWRGKRVSKADVKNLSYGEALEIFAAQYWSVIDGEQLPLSAALITYNAAVNSGPARAVRFLQKALNRQGEKLDVDGEIGPLTLGACKSANLDELVRDYSEIYGDFYEALPTFATFGRGWMNRLKDVASTARLWAEREADKLTDHERAKPVGMPDGAEDNLTSFDRMTGGRPLAGKKTIIATSLYVAIVLAQSFGLLEGTILDGLSLPESGANAANQDSVPRDGAGSSPVVEFLKTVLLSFAGLSALSKVERGLKILRPTGTGARRFAR